MILKLLKLSYQDSIFELGGWFLVLSLLSVGTFSRETKSYIFLDRLFTSTPFIYVTKLISLVILTCELVFYFLAGQILTYVTSGSKANFFDDQAKLYLFMLLIIPFILGFFLTIDLPFKNFVLSSLASSILIIIGAVGVYFSRELQTALIDQNLKLGIVLVVIGNILLLIDLLPFMNENILESLNYEDYSN